MADDPTISLSILIVLAMPVTMMVHMYDPGNTFCVDFQILKDHDW